MVDKSTLEALLERVESATGPDRDIDEAAHAALLPDHEFGQLADAPEGVGCMMYRWPDGHQSSALRITSSIDAALALVERLLPGCIWSLEADACWIRVPTEDDVAEFQGNKSGMAGKWTPIAIVAALLKALIAQEATCAS